MADPLSITAGVFSVLGSLTTLTLKLNEIQSTIQEASTEVRQLTEEVDSLKLILRQLGEIQLQGGVASNLRDDLATLLQLLHSTVTDVDYFLRNTLKRSFRGAFWAFSGKSKSAQFCRRLESYKATLNMTLIISTISSGQELHGRADEILNGINDIRARLPNENGYILQRYLTELETVYECSTIAGSIEPERGIEIVLPDIPELQGTDQVPPVMKPIASSHSNSKPMLNAKDRREHAISTSWSSTPQQPKPKINRGCSRVSILAALAIAALCGLIILWKQKAITTENWF
ncbi:hypothetical protein TWF694_000346 [Orbilia ellipsospora]|uniref:Azaphilone pigments biosynthesis cluster protein L N-terminal domain-containing protein n=1 Tax=Orbilia ellipsospora TaxID=2528407 RepID=A0AAV9XNN8_9PEZI